MSRASILSQPVGVSRKLEHFQAESAETSDTANLLNQLPGTSVYSAGGVSGLPVIDGFAADRLHVEVAGMDLMAACANQMNPPLSYIAPPQVGSITVYSNIVPVSVGGDSIGGAILVEPRAPAFAPAGQGIVTSANVGGYYRSNGDAFGGNVSAAAAAQNFSMGYDGTYAKSSNYTAGGNFKPAGPAFMGVPGINQDIPFLGADEVGSTAYEAMNHNFAVAARNGDHLFKLDLGIQHIPYQLYPNQRMDMTDNKSINGIARYTGDFEWGVLKASVYDQYVRHEMNFGADKQYYYGGAMSDGGGMSGGGMSGMAEGGSGMSGGDMSGGDMSGGDMSGGDMGDGSGMMSSEIAPGMPMNTRAKNLGASLGADFGLSSRDIMRVGAEYQNYRYNDWWPPSPVGGTGMMAPETFLEINDGRRDRADAYVEWDRAWTSAWTSQLGVRSDTVMMDTGKVHGYNAMYDAPPLFPATTFNDADRSRVDSNWDVTAQAVYTPDLTETYSFGYSRTTRSPNLYERYSWSPDTMAAEMIGWFGDGNYYIGNLDLDPEVAHTVSGTADFHDATRTMGIAVTPYYSYVSDYIDVRRCPTQVCGDTQAVIDSLTARQGFVYLQFINQDAQLFGVDVAGRALLAENTRFGTFTARGLLSYVEGTNIVTDDHLYHMLPVNGKIALEQRIGRWTNVIETVLVGEKFLVSQVHNEVETGAYALLNLRSSYQWNNLRVDFGVENLFDTFYDLPLGGLYLGQGATMAGDGIPWGIALPGMGRSVYVATNLKF